MKKNPNVESFEAEMNARPVAQPVTNPEKKYTMPEDSLQSVFADSYMRERERFNSMYGVLENNPPFEYPQYAAKTPQSTAQTQQDAAAEEIPSDTVPLKKYKKVKCWLVTFILLFAVALGGIAYLVVSELL